MRTMANWLVLGKVELIVGLAAAFGGCAVPMDGTPRPVDSEPIQEKPAGLTVDEAFAPDERGTVEAAWDEWLSVGATLPPVTFRQADEPWVVEGRLSWGRYDPETSEVWIVAEEARHPSMDLWRFALHELGHAAGIRGHHEGFGIMAHVQDFDELPACISSSDLAELGTFSLGTCPGLYPEPTTR